MCQKGKEKQSNLDVFIMTHNIIRIIAYERTRFCVTCVYLSVEHDLTVYISRRYLLDRFLSGKIRARVRGSEGARVVK